MYTYTYEMCAYIYIYIYIYIYTYTHDNNCAASGPKQSGGAPCLCLSDTVSGVLTPILGSYHYYYHYQ